MKHIANIRKNTIGLLAVLVMATSAAAAQRSELTGTKWQLTHVNGRAIATNKAFLEFDAKERRFTGNAGCNRMFGDVHVSGRRIDFGSVATTKMACADPSISRVERSFTSNLESVKRFRRTNSTLEFLNGGRTVLRFRAARSGDGELESKKWIADEIGGKPIRVKGTTPFIAFDSAKSSAGGNTGCNVFGGSYDVSGSTVRIFDTISTMRACIEDDRMAVERLFLDALQNANRFEISGNKLFLYRGNKLLIKFNGAAK